jgi:2-keto-4-pentenoate hydratase
VIARRDLVHIRAQEVSRSVRWLARGLIASLLLAVASPASAQCPAPELAPPASAVSALLLAGRLEGRALAAPPSAAAGGALSLEEAYAIQDDVACALAERLGALAGWKIAFASRAVQERFAIGEPAAAALYAAQRVPNGATLRAEEFAGGVFHLEPEIAFTIGRRIDAPVASVEALRPHVRSLHSAFDLPERRYPWEEGGVADAVADAIGAHRFALGPPVAPQGRELASLVLGARRGEETVSGGPAAAVMGDPWNALLWLANQLVARGRALEPGQVVLSGAAAPAFAAHGASAAGHYVGGAEGLPPVVCTVAAP